MRVHLKLAIGTTVCSLMASSAQSERATNGITEVTTIQDTEGNGRILFNWSAPIIAEHFTVSRAILRFHLAGEVDSRTIRLVAHPITKEWDPETVTWTRGWNEPGGDFDREQSAYADLYLPRGAGESCLDITNAIRETLRTGDPSYGLLLTTVPEDGVGIRSEDLDRFTGLPDATLEVSWRKTPPPPTEVAQ